MFAIQQTVYELRVYGAKLDYGSLGVTRSGIWAPSCAFPFTRGIMTIPIAR